LKNILLKIEYLGTRYRGWQTQRVKSSQGQKQDTVQETIEAVIRRILQHKVNLTASGRTDAGVHALGQCANFKTGSGLSLAKLKKSLNSLLPEDIRISSAKVVKSGFHARYNAKSKMYRYTILNREYGSVFMRETSLHVKNHLDIKAMRKAAKVLKGRHDFKSFQASDSRKNNSVRTIKKICVKKRGSFITIDIEADGFLYNMARNIVGTLIEVGRQKITAQNMKEILRKKDRKSAGPTAPAEGLCLVKVIY